MSAQGFLADAATRHQIYVQRYAGGNLKRAAKFISKAINTAKERVAAGLSAYGTKRYASQIDALSGDLAAIYGDMKGQVVMDLTDFGAYEAEFNATMLGKVVKAVVQFNVPAPEMVAAAALADPLELEARKGLQRISISGALDQFGTKKAAEIIGEIQIGSALGETSQQIGGRLSSVHQMQQDQASALVRTMTNHVASTARAQVMESNDDILQGWRWISTLDKHTTPMCQDRDQHLYGWDDPKPPGHWNCRSSSVPVLKDEFAREIKVSTRPAVGPNGAELVSSKTTYQEWLSRQPASFQRDVLGPNRYELFTKGELTLDKFVDDNGKTLTLAQLREKEAAAFERAGL
ncbi:Phage Mu protein F like protein [compost metagenome]